MTLLKNIYWLILVALSLQTVIIPPDLAAADKIYYTVGAPEYALKSSNLDGSGVQTLWPDDGWGPNNVAVDTANGKVYVKDNVANTLKRCNLDGTAQETFLAADVNDMDVDTVGGKIYYTVGAPEYALKRSNLDGSGVQTLWPDDGWGPNNVAVDTANGKVYVKDNVANTLKRCNLDGTGQETFLAADVNDMDVDTVGGKIYYTVGAPEYALKRSNLDGSSVQTLWPDDGWGPNNVTVDAVNGKVYVKDNVANALKRCNLDGTGQETFLAADVGDMDVAVSLAPAPEIVTTGNSVSIANGDTTPSLTDHTDFGSIAVLAGTITRTFTVQNTGNADLTLGSVTLSGTNAADFNVNVQPTSPVSASGSTTFQVTFDPNGSGVRTAGISFSNNDSNENPFTFSIQGTGLTTPTVTTSAAASISATSATLGGNVSDDGGATVSERGVVYSASDTVPEIGDATVTKDTNGSGTGIFSESIGSLLPNTTYYFQAYAINSQGTSYGGVESFTTLSSPPTITTDAASAVTTTTATLNGTVNANNSSTAVTFQYGLTDAYGTTVTADQSPVSGTSDTAVSKGISGLVPNTTYHYRAVGVNVAGTVNGADMTFTTGTIAPTVTTSAASAVATTTATLNGIVNANNSSTTVTFEYGLTDAYGTTVTADQSPVSGTSNTAVSKGLTGLVPNTTYHYRAVGVNVAGTVNGADMTFTTGTSAPTLTTDAASAVSTTTATLNGTVNANNSSTTVTFEYGLTDAYGTTVTADQSPVSGTSNTAVSKGLTGLVPNTTYHYRAVGVNVAGTVNGADMTFTTGTSAPTLTTDAASAVTTTTATLNGTVNANNSSTTVTFEYGLTDAYGTTVTADQSPVSGISDTAVSKALTGLDLDTTYHYRVVGVNVAGTVNGADMTFTTGASVPTLTTDAASAVTTTTATLNGTVNANSFSTTVTFEYGLTDAYGTTVTADQSPVIGTSDTAVSKALAGLAPDTTYHYRVVGVNVAGTVNGADMTFITQKSQKNDFPWLVLLPGLISPNKISDGGQ